jgi:putative transposase
MDAQHTKHVTYKLANHFVWCPKYRKKILVGKLATFLEQEIRRIREANTWTIGALNVQEDHVHLFLSAPPSVAPSQIAHTLKGMTARKVFQHFPEVKKQLRGGARHGPVRTMWAVSEI